MFEKRFLSHIYPIVELIVLGWNPANVLAYVPPLGPNNHKVPLHFEFWSLPLELTQMSQSNWCIVYNQTQLEYFNQIKGELVNNLKHAAGECIKVFKSDKKYDLLAEKRH